MNYFGISQLTVQWTLDAETAHPDVLLETVAQKLPTCSSWGQISVMQSGISKGYWRLSIGDANGNDQ